MVLRICTGKATGRVGKMVLRSLEMIHFSLFIGNSFIEIENDFSSVGFIVCVLLPTILSEGEYFLTSG